MAYKCFFLFICEDANLTSSLLFPHQPGLSSWPRITLLTIRLMERPMYQFSLYTCTESFTHASVAHQIRQAVAQSSKSFHAGRKCCVSPSPGNFMGINNSSPWRFHPRFLLNTIHFEWPLLFCTSSLFVKCRLQTIWSALWRSVISVPAASNVTVKASSARKEKRKDWLTASFSSDRKICVALRLPNNSVLFWLCVCVGVCVWLT